MKELAIRILDCEDLDAVQILFTAVFTQAPWNDDWSNKDQLKNYLLDLMDTKCSLCLGLYEEGDLVGLSLGRILHWYSGSEYHIQEFCIRNGEQARGLGTRFLSLMEGLLVKRGIVSIFLTTDRTTLAYRFYCKLGFSELRDQCFLYKNLGKE